jgi:Uma2 family endonuclease
VRTLLCTQQSRTLPRAAELPTTAAEPTFMGMPDILTPVYWTADMARHLPEDGNRYEVVYGELLVTPAPRLWHQQLVQRLSFTLAKYLEIHRAGVVLTSPADISWGRDVLVQPDVFVVPVEQARTLEWSAIRDLLLVAEVLSPSTPRHDASPSAAAIKRPVCRCTGSWTARRDRWRSGRRTTSFRASRGSD